MSVCTHFVFQLPLYPIKRQNLCGLTQAIIISKRLFCYYFGMVVIVCALCAMGYYALSWLRIYENKKGKEKLFFANVSRDKRPRCSTSSFNNTFAEVSV